MDESSQGRSANVIRLARQAFVEESDITVTYSRSSGPGGQHVNKVSTRATLRVPVDVIQGMDHHARRRLRDLAGHRLTSDDDIVIHADTTRSQRRNREEAIERLRDLVRRALIRPKPRIRTKPSKAMIERRIQAKKRRGERKRNRGKDWE